MGVSRNRGTPKWMVYNGKPYWNGWFGGTIIFGNTRICPPFSVDSRLVSRIAGRAAMSPRRRRIRRKWWYLERRWVHVSHRVGVVVEGWLWQWVFWCIEKYDDMYTYIYIYIVCKFSNCQPSDMKISDMKYFLHEMSEQSWNFQSFRGWWTEDCMIYERSAVCVCVCVTL